MALDLERLKASLAVFESADAELQARYRRASASVLGQLKEALPALCESDQAAVAFYIAQLLSSARNLSVRDAGDVITDTAIGYSLGAAQLLGMLDQ